MHWKSPVTIGLLLSCVITLLVNAPTLVDRARFGTWDRPLVESSADEDEARYFARIREVVDGYPLIGNPILKEHRADISPNGFAEWITAGIIITTGMPLGTAIALTDIAATFLNVLLAYLWVWGLLRHPMLAVAAATVFWADVWGVHYLVRDATKLTLLFPNLFLCLLFLPDRERRWHRLARGVLLGAMFHTYSYHWTVLAAFEGLLLLHALLIRRQPIRAWIADAACVFGPFALLALPYAIALLSRKADPAFLETYRHFGVIQSRLPGAPALQAVLWTWLIALVVAWRARLLTGRRPLLLLFLLMASVIAVNANVVTGHEADFQGHYGRFVRLFTVAGLFLCLGIFLLWAGKWVGVAMTVLVAASVLRTLPVAIAESPLPAWQASDERRVLAWLDERLPAESVVLASYNTLARLVPVYTAHYVLTGPGARIFFATDRELFERYIVQLAFFPEDEQPTSIGAQPVFGNYPGQAFARARTTHQLATLFQKPFDKTIADFIPDQTIRARLERDVHPPAPVEVRSLLRRYAPDVLVTAKPLPRAYADLFTSFERVGAYTVYRFVPASSP
ncbi:MAG: hypothetical protein G01um101425_62 [Candidatus Peregrinibacteria bacterium Gr01-1014_25]|nr:MAG: hypothetical protein G01um101425_62 [Candidatus Peregrinibacteria bacterium Gr01-1014_25]